MILRWSYILITRYLRSSILVSICQLSLSLPTLREVEFCYFDLFSTLLLVLIANIYWVLTMQQIVKWIKWTIACIYPYNNPLT